MIKTFNPRTDNINFHDFLILSVIQDKKVATVAIVFQTLAQKRYPVIKGTIKKNIKKNLAKGYLMEEGKGKYRIHPDYQDDILQVRVNLTHIFKPY